MKRIVLIFFFFIGFSSYGQHQQDTSFFEISTLDGAAFLDPKLPQRPADSIKCCNNYLAYDEEYMEETFFSKMNLRMSIVRKAAQKGLDPITLADCKRAFNNVDFAAALNLVAGIAETGQTGVLFECSDGKAKAKFIVE